MRFFSDIRSTSGLLSRLTLLAALAGVTSAAIPTDSSYTAAQISNGFAFQNITNITASNQQYIVNSRGSTQCTYANAKVRKEWRQLDQATRQSYTDAVTCLQQMKPTVMTAAQAPSYPGIKSRYDEYVATHINYTYHIHDTADFFAWHRTFIHFLEKDLQTLCGYTGVLPYWNWALDAAAPQNSSIFNGDTYSMGSNGKYISGRKSVYLYTQGINMPPGTGGGCLTGGPFSSYTVNLGPLSLASTPNVNSSFEYNPRCLARDINPFFTKQYNTYNNVTRLLLENTNIQAFQSVAQGYAGANNKFGVHGGAHWGVGTGVGSMADFNSSPADPIFYLHHAMVDFVWSNWQWLDYANRGTAIQGTSTLNNSPPSANMTLNDMLPFGFVAPAVRFGDVMDHFGGLNGSLCYRYA